MASRVVDATNDGSGKEAEISSKSSDAPQTKDTKVDYDAKAINKPKFSDFFVLPLANSIVMIADNIQTESLWVYHDHRQSHPGNGYVWSNGNWSSRWKPSLPYIVLN